MDEWISIEDELIVKVASFLPLIVGDLKHEDSRRVALKLIDELDEYIQANNLDFTKEETAPEDELLFSKSKKKLPEGVYAVHSLDPDLGIMTTKFFSKEEKDDVQEK